MEENFSKLVEEVDQWGEPVSEEKMSPEEAEAAGYYFGISNMGMGDVSRLMRRGRKSTYRKYGDIVTMNMPDWKKVKSRLYNDILVPNMESDEMLDGAMKEINSWVREMKRGDKATVAMWNDVKAGKESSKSEPAIVTGKQNIIEQ